MSYSFQEKCCFFRIEEFSIFVLKTITCQCGTCDFCHGRLVFFLSPFTNASSHSVYQQINKNYHNFSCIYRRSTRSCLSAFSILVKHLSLSRFSSSFKDDKNNFEPNSSVLTMGLLWSWMYFSALNISTILNPFNK